MRLDEELHGEGLEWKDGRVEGDAKSNDIPVTHAKLEQVGKDDFVGGGFSQVEVLLRLRLHDPINDGPDDAEDREGKGNQERPAPVGISRARPSWGIERGERAQSADGQVDPESEAQFLALEPPRQSSRDRNVQRFSSHAEDKPSRRHDREVTRRCGNGRADQAEHAENHQRLPQAETVNDEAADDDGEDIWKAVNRLEQADVFVREPKLLL